MSGGPRLTKKALELYYDGEKNEKALWSIREPDYYSHYIRAKDWWKKKGSALYEAALFSSGTLDPLDEGDDRPAHLLAQQGRTHRFEGVISDGKKPIIIVTKIEEL